MNKKKALFVIGMDYKWEEKLYQTTNISPENMLILRVYGPAILAPYGDLMRTIILAVHQEDIDEIFVVGTKDDRENTVDMQNLVNRMYENEGLKSQIKVMDYLFKYSTPKFPKETIREWLEGDEIQESVQKSIQVIRKHPLVPPYVRVQGLLLNEKNEELVAVEV